MSKILAAAIALVIAMIVVMYSSSNREPVATAPEPVTQSVSQPSPASPEQIHTHEFAAKNRVPAFYESAPAVNSLPSTLSPELFTGNQRLAYRAAREIPQVLAQLPCYCHCDRSIG